MSGSTLICFAVKEEAAPFRKLAAGRDDLQILVTGMGRDNSERSLRAALAEKIPARVFTCGFAGGLNPALASGEVIFSAGEAAALLTAGARPVIFHCASRIAVTAAEKTELRLMTGADAVEMESEFIHAICRAQNIPCATVRVISDTADEDLPLDFNQLTTPEQNMDFGKLALALVKSPGKIGGLLKLQRQTRAAAENLARVLAKITAR